MYDNIKMCIKILTLTIEIFSSIKHVDKIGRIINSIKHEM